MRALRDWMVHERLPKVTTTIQDIFTAPHVVLLGHPGTGKSTTLKYVTYAIAAGLANW